MSLLSSPNFSSKGFTLIELLIVITIIGVLSIIGVAAYRGVTANLTKTKRMGDLVAIAKAYENKYSQVGSYQALIASDLTTSNIPTPYPGGTYFMAGPNTTTTPTNNNFAVCASLVDDNQCYATSNTCHCIMSTQGSPVDTFSLGSFAQQGSFETDSNSDGLSDAWTTYRSVNSVALVSTPTPIDGSLSQKVVVNSCCYAGITQTITGLRPLTTYKQTAWMYLESGYGACGSVGVGMQGPGGETFTGCDRRDQWVKLTLTGQSDSSGNYVVNFQNWTDNAVFYVDGVRVEEMIQ